MEHAGEITFRKSTFCTDGECVEVGFIDGGVMVRDSKHRGGPALGFTQSEWDTFLKGVRAGEFE